MSGEDGNEEFYRQLQLQQQYEAKPAEGECDPFTFVDPADGAAYEWDLEKKAWFPKITEDFLATYHANYGFHADETDTSSASGTATESKQPVSSKASGTQPSTNETGQKQTDPKQKSEKRKLEPGWFHVEEDRNTNVYVTGLPPDITKDEFVQVMSKCGIIMRDPQTEEHKIKLYKDKEGNLKGDGLCCYLKRESVQLALRLLDEAEIRGYKLHVEVAKFQLKGEYDASKKKKKCKDYKKKLSQQQKQLDWRPEKKDGATRMRHERIVIIRNMFHPKDFEEDPLVLNEIREDLRTECEKFGQVKKVLIFDRHPDGVASVSFKEATEADLCKLTLNGRWFGGRQLSAETWDGVTDYQVEETAREREERLKVWESFLGDPDSKEQQTTSDFYSASSNVKLPEGKQPPEVNDTPKESANDEAHKRENNGEGINEDGAPSTDSSLAGSDVKDTIAFGAQGLQFLNHMPELPAGPNSYVAGTCTQELICWTQHECPTSGKSDCCDTAADSELRDYCSLKMEETRKLSPKPSKSKELVKTEWGSQSVVFTYFQGDINSMVDEHFSRALSNVKNPQDLSIKHKGETVVLKNDSLSPHQWNFSSHCYKPYPSSSSTSMANSALNFSAAGVVGQCQPSSLRSRPAQPADLWPFPPIGTPSVTSSVYSHTLPDLHVADEPISDRKYSSLLGLLQQERCLTSMQECTMKQHSSSACMTGPARLQNMSQSSVPGGERKASSYQGSENPSVSHAGIQIHDRRRDLYF